MRPLHRHQVAGQRVGGRRHRDLPPGDLDPRLRRPIAPVRGGIPVNHNWKTPRRSSGPGRLLVRLAATGDRRGFEAVRSKSPIPGAAAKVDQAGRTCSAPKGGPSPAGVPPPGRDAERRRWLDQLKTLNNRVIIYWSGDSHHGRPPRRTRSAWSPAGCPFGTDGIDPLVPGDLPCLHPADFVPARSLARPRTRQAKPPSPTGANHDSP